MNARSTTLRRPANRSQTVATLSFLATLSLLLAGLARAEVVIGQNVEAPGEPGAAAGPLPRASATANKSPCSPT